MFQRQVCPHIVYLRPGTCEDVMQVADERPLFWPRQLLVPLQPSCDSLIVSDFDFNCLYESVPVSPCLLPSCVAKGAAAFNLSSVLGVQQGFVRVHMSFYQLQKHVGVLRKIL